MKKTAFAIGCHPDDIEFMMSGTLMRLKAAGYAIHYLNVANGSCGTQQYGRDAIVGIRREEAREAARLIGAEYHDSLVDDIEVYYAREPLARLAAIMREVAPDIVLTHYPNDYMEDHSNTCRLAVTAAFCRGMRNFITQPPRQPIDRSVTLYHALPFSLRDPLRRRVEAGVYVDVGDLLDSKTDMLACHRSQKEWLDVSQGMDAYLDALRQMCREVGRQSGVFAAAEGWIRHLHQGFGGSDDDPLAETLGAHARVNAAFEARL